MENDIKVSTLSELIENDMSNKNSFGSSNNTRITCDCYDNIYGENQIDVSCKIFSELKKITLRLSYVILVPISETKTIPYAIHV